MAVRSRLMQVVVLLALVVGLPILALAQDGAPVGWPDLAGREVTIAMTNDYPPYQYYDDNNELVGWEYDALRDICTLINCTPVFVQTTWDGMLIAIASGEFDMGAGGITYTAARDESVDFTQLFQTYDETLMVRAGEDRFTTSAELIALGDFMIGTQLGTTNEIAARAIFGDEHVVAYEDFPGAILALQNDDVDAVQIDRPAANGYIEAQGGMVTLAESLTGVQGLSFPMAPGSDLVYPFNAAISALQASGRWDELYAKWFEAQ